MKNQKIIENSLINNEKIICSSKQSLKLLPWVIKNIIVLVVVMGIPFVVFKWAPFIPLTWIDFINKNVYIYYIYAGLAGVWLLTLIVVFFIKKSKFACHQVFLTNKRLLVLCKEKLTTILFAAITSVTMSPTMKHKADIKIQTITYTYSLDKMKDGNTLIKMLTKILLGDNFENLPVDKLPEIDQEPNIPVIEEDKLPQKIVETNEDSTENNVVEENLINDNEISDKDD